MAIADIAPNTKYSVEISEYKCPDQLKRWKIKISVEKYQDFSAKKRHVL